MVTNLAKFDFIIILDKEELQKLEHIIDPMTLEFHEDPLEGDEYIHSYSRSHSFTDSSRRRI